MKPYYDNKATSYGNSVIDGGRRGAGRMFTDYLQKWKQNKQAAMEDKRKQDPRYYASQLMTESRPEAEAAIEKIKNSPYLDEFMKARTLASDRIEGQFGAAQREGELGLKRALAAQGGTSSGHALRLAGEQRAGLEREKAGAMTEALGGIDVAEAQERQRRIEKTEEFAFQKESFGQNMMLQWDQFDLAQKESVFNQMVALKESGINPNDIANLQSLFQGMRVDVEGSQSLPSTYKVKKKGGMQSWETKYTNDPRYFDSSKYEYRY